MSSTITQLQGLKCKRPGDTRMYPCHFLAQRSVGLTQGGEKELGKVVGGTSCYPCFAAPTQEATLMHFGPTTAKLGSQPLLHIRKLESLCQEGFHCVDNRIISPLIKPDHSALLAPKPVIGWLRCVWNAILPSP